MEFGPTSLPAVIAARAEATPTRTFARVVDGETYTYRDVDLLAQRWMTALRAAGVSRDDAVLTMLPPGIEWLTAWIGLSRCRALDCGVNSDYFGPMLRYAVETTGAKVAIVSARYLQRFAPEASGCAPPELIVVVPDESGAAAAGPGMIGSEAFLDVKPAPPEVEQPGIWDLAGMVLTSGTTGPSKWVRCPWGMCYSGAGALPLDTLGPDDVLYMPLPVFHNAARFTIFSLALAGGGIVLRPPGFSLSAFWDDIREYGCTLFQSFFTQLLLEQPERPDDADNPVRGVLMVPLHPRYEYFCQRFGVRVCTGYGSSEAGLAITTGWDPRIPASSGRIPVTDYPGMRARIVDEHDIDVPVGEVGELVLRTEPWGIFAGYHRKPEATAEAFRNLWFHTGDGFRRDAEDNFYFVDRVKDAIRRRGENISSFEVEAAVNSHPDVQESAAIGIAVPGEEQEIKVFAVRRGTALPTHTDLAGHLAERLPRFMVPRYLEFVDALPKTEASNRIKKAVLRERGLTGQTWDCTSGHLVEG